MSLLSDEVRPDTELAALVKRNQDARVMLGLALDDIEAGETVDFAEVGDWWTSLVDSCAEMTATLAANRLTERTRPEDVARINGLAHAIVCEAVKVHELGRLNDDATAYLIPIDAFADLELPIDIAKSRGLLDRILAATTQQEEDAR